MRTRVGALVLSLALVALGCGGGGGTDAGRDAVMPGDGPVPGPDGTSPDAVFEEVPDVGGEEGRVDAEVAGADVGGPEDGGPGDVPAGDEAPDVAEVAGEVAGDVGPDLPGTDPVPADWCGRWSAAWCALKARCTLPADPSWTESGCQVEAARECWAGRFLAGAVDAGDVTFDGAAGSVCLDALASVSCAAYDRALATDPRGALPECGKVVSGTRTEGAPCALGVECAAGYGCAFGAACPGTCTAWVGLEGACDDARWCQPDAALCVGGACESLPGDGEACPEGACRQPFACDIDGHCRTPSVEGEPCGPGEAPCLTGLVCLQSSPAVAGTCHRPLGRDAACFDDTQCGPWAGLPQACVAGACGALPGDGEPCYGFLCAGAWCDTAAIPPTCRRLPADGEACVQGALCGAGLWCDGGTCVGARADGAPCAYPAQCASSRCLSGRCVAAGDPPCLPSYR